MTRLLKWTALAIAISLVALGAHVARTWNRVWDAPLPSIHARLDAESVKRGEYLVYGPAHCVDCHAESTSALDEYERTGVRPRLIGGMAFAVPPIGTVFSRNLTPDTDTGIGRYSDGQLARLLRYSVLPDGRASVRPLMEYAGMSDDDIVAIIAFLRSQPAVRHRVREDEWTVIGKIVKSLSPAFMPRTNVVAPRTAPPAQPTRQRGEYLARAVGNCGGCHSPMNPITFQLSGAEFSGGVPMEPRRRPGVDGTQWFQPPNLTPTDGSAIRRFPDRDVFVARFLRGGVKYPASPMPWECFNRMTAEDAGALYEFFRSLPPSGDSGSFGLVPKREQSQSPVSG